MPPQYAKFRHNLERNLVSELAFRCTLVTNITINGVEIGENLFTFVERTLSSGHIQERIYPF